MYKQIQTKRLFGKEEPLTFNGYTCSLEAYRFLKFILVVDPRKRPDWKAVADYPNILKAADLDLSQRFIKQCDVEVNSRLNCDEEFVYSS